MPLGLHTASLNFETKKEIGQEGRNSTVFIAHDKQLDGEIVIKKILKSKIPNATEYYDESKLLYNSKHQNIVQVIYGCEDIDHIYIAMPYYKMGSLKSLIDSRFLTVREIVRYSIQFLSGLNHIHSKGLLHFDIKPDNILISNSNEALLSDFGLSKAMDSLGFASQKLVYPKQVPPEKFSQTKFSVQYDIYLVGLTIYRLCNGNDIFNKQFNFSTQKEYIDSIIAGRYPDRNFYFSHIPKRLQKIIKKALNVNPALRHNNVLELINELSSIDTNLDWQFSITHNGHVWDLDKDDRTFNIQLTKNGLNSNNFDITTFRYMKGSQITKQNAELSFKDVLDSEVLKTLEKIFKALN